MRRPVRSARDGGNASDRPRRAPSIAPSDPAAERLGRPESGWRRRLYVIIFESETRAGRAFDVTVILLILASCAVVVLDSVPSLHADWAPLFESLEWAFTVVFAAEYLARIACVRHPLRYMTSFYGVIDLLAVLPAFLAIVFPGVPAVINVRLLRLLRIFRILKLGAYAAEFGALGRALAASRRKIIVFVGFVLLVVVIMGTLMYVIEGPENGFTSIPTGIYWAITTLTTVGFGDIAPKTTTGRLIASLMMLLGWGTLAVPTGIVSAEFTARRELPSGPRLVDGTAAPLPQHAPDHARDVMTRTCPECLSEGHVASARFCQDCGATLPPHMDDLALR